MMSALVFFPILLIIISVVIILPIVLICVLLFGRQRKPAASPVVQPATNDNPEARNQRREAILGQLANKTISREEAERQLRELDNPLPEQMPAAPPPAGNGCGKGCLVAGICAIIALGVLLLLLLGMFGITGRTMHRQAIRIEEMR